MKCLKGKFGLLCLDCHTKTEGSQLPQGPKLLKLKAADFGLFAASWWPQASFRRLRTLTHLSIWLFTWDDEIDEPGGTFADSMEGANEYRRETKHYVQQCLGLENSEGAIPVNAIVGSFKVIGDHFRAVYNSSKFYNLAYGPAPLTNSAQCKRLFNEIARLVDNSQLEQDLRLKDCIPTIQEYWKFRMGTSAVGVALAALE